MERIKYVASRVGHIWDDVTDLIIRPQRREYTLSDLGPKVFRISDYNNSVFQRIDMELENMRGMKIQCSWYQPMKMDAMEPMPCVVYLHGNCGCRIDGMELLWVLRHGMTLFTYDACGSGISDGDHVTLGFYERQDLAAVCEFLHSTKKVLSIGLWGRSMGAVTSIMYAAKDQSISCIVCDSPFSSLGKLTEDLVQMHASWVPNFVANSAVARVRKKVTKKAGFDFRELNTVQHAANCTVPAFMFHGEGDDFVLPSHSITLSEHYGGSCLHRLVKGGHNSDRGADVQNVAVPFLKLYLIEKLKSIDKSPEALVRRNHSSQLMTKKAQEEIASETSPKRSELPTVDDMDEIEDEDVAEEDGNDDFEDAVPQSRQQQQQVHTTASNPPTTSIPTHQLVSSDEEEDD